MKIFGSAKNTDNSTSAKADSPQVDSVPTQSNSSGQFRRGQTITGSVSPNIHSSNEASATMLSPRAHVHHLSRRRRSLGWRLVAVSRCLLGSYLLVSQLVATLMFVRIEEATVSAADTRQLCKYGAAVLRKISIAEVLPST